MKRQEEANKTKWFHNSIVAIYNAIIAYADLPDSYCCQRSDCEPSQDLDCISSAKISIQQQAVNAHACITYQK
jgi:hypothetical protein